MSTNSKNKTCQHDAEILGRTIGQLETHISNLNKSLDELKKLFKSVEYRLISVEKEHSFVRGCIGILLTIGGFFGIALDHISRWVFGR